MTINDDQNIDTFIGFDLHGITIPLIVVYKNTSDYPEKYVARLWDSDSPTIIVVVKDTLEEIRNEIPIGMLRINRNPNDDPVIMEAWM